MTAYPVFVILPSSVLKSLFFPKNLIIIQTHYFGMQNTRSHRFALIFSIISAYSLSLSLICPGFMAKTPPHS